MVNKAKKQLTSDTVLRDRSGRALTKKEKDALVRKIIIDGMRQLTRGYEEQIRRIEAMEAKYGL